MDLLISILLGAPPFALAIMLHEASHAFAAWKLGDPTGRNTGRISLDPRRHLDPLGAVFYVVTMLASRGHFAFGWAKPVLINPYNFRDWRRDFMLSSLAGPASNLAQAGVWALLMRLYVFGLPPSLHFRALEFIITYGILINVALAVFNLIPIPPLDGSRLLAWMLPERLAYGLDRLERFGFIIVFVLLYLRLFDVVFQLIGLPLLDLFRRVAGV